MSATIIAFSGRRGAGKSSAAMYLCRRYGFRVISFGAALRAMAKEFFPFTAKDFTELGKETPYDQYDWTPRDFLIALGKMARYFDEDFWVKKAMLDGADGRIVLDDLRFPNELSYLLGLGAKIVRINRYEHLNVYGKNLDDPSETALDKHPNFDYTIHECRNMTMNDLHAEVDNMLSVIYPNGLPAECPRF